MVTIEKFFSARKITILPLVVIGIHSLIYYQVSSEIEFDLLGLGIELLNIIVSFYLTAWLYTTIITGTNSSYKVFFIDPLGSVIFTIALVQLKLLLLMMLIGLPVGILSVIAVIKGTIPFLDHETVSGLVVFFQGDLPEGKSFKWFTAMIIMSIAITMSVCNSVYFRCGFGIYSLTANGTQTTLRESWKLSKGMTKISLLYGLGFLICLGVGGLVGFYINGAENLLFQFFLV